MLSWVEENYLKAIHSLWQREEMITVNALSGQLKIKMPTVTSMMKRLSEKKLIRYVPYKPIQFTSKGKKMASMIIRKHRLAEMFLVEKMGFGWEEVHEIAEQLEHIQSELFFERMDEMLGYPKIDPHGSPIPDADGNMQWKEFRKLSDCRANDNVRLVAVINSEPSFLKYLTEKSIRLGIEIRIDKKEDFDGMMVVQYLKRQETISAAVCNRLLVENID